MIIFLKISLLSVFEETVFTNVNDIIIKFYKFCWNYNY